MKRTSPFYVSMSTISTLRLPSGLGLRSQLGHGDFWGNNVRFRGGDVALVTNLDFMCERLRVDDLALTLYFASFNLAGLTARAAMKHLAGLVGAYDGGERRIPCPPWKGQPCRSPWLARRSGPSGVWAALLDDECAARRHIRGHLAVVGRGLDVLAPVERWQEALQ